MPVKKEKRNKSAVTFVMEGFGNDMILILWRNVGSTFVLAKPKTGILKLLWILHSFV